MYRLARLVALSVLLVGLIRLQAAPVGINIGGPKDFAPSLYFADAMKTARGWAKPSNRYTAGDVALDAHGWPTEDAAVVINASVPGIAGTYRLSFTGKADVAALDGGSVEALRYDAGKNQTTADVVFPEGNGVFSLAFTNTKGGVKDVRLLRPEPADGLYTQRFLAMLRPFATLRFMDWTLTNGSKLEKWSDRSSVNDAIWSKPKGVPMEVCVDLANKLGKDAWFCVPHLADDNYAREMARLVRDRIDPKLTVYVEYSNELWNFQFPQTLYYKKLAGDWFDAEVAAGRCVESDRNRVMYPQMWRMIADRSNAIMKIWRAEFGPGRKLVTVIGSQASNSYIGKSLVSHGETAKVTDALAIAPYFGHDYGSAKKADATLAGGIDGLFASLDEELDTKNRRWIEQNAQIARDAGMKLIAYEGGQHLVPASGSRDRDKDLNTLFKEANLDPRMGDLYRKHHRNWAAAGGEAYVFYSFMSIYNTSGYWGLWYRMDQPLAEAPKAQAVLDIIKQR